MFLFFLIASTKILDACKHFCVNDMSINKTFAVHNEVLSVILINRNVLRFILELGAKIILLHHKICLELNRILKITFVTINPFFYQSRQP